MIPTRHEPDQTSRDGAGPAVMVAGVVAAGIPACRGAGLPSPAAKTSRLIPSREKW